MAHACPASGSRVASRRAGINSDDRKRNVSLFAKHQDRSVNHRGIKEGEGPRVASPIINFGMQEKEMRKKRNGRCRCRGTRPESEFHGDWMQLLIDAGASRRVAIRKNNVRRGGLRRLRPRRDLLAYARGKAAPEGCCFDRPDILCS